MGLRWYYDSIQGLNPANSGHSGILLYAMNPETGALSRRDFSPRHFNPFWLILSVSGEFLYSANETDNVNGQKAGAISAFAVDLSSGRLTWLKDVDSQGTGAAHMSVHPSGKYAFVANYNGGTFAVLPLLPDGKLGNATDCQKGLGAVGPERAASGPAGSFAVSGRDSPHAHMIQADPSGRYVLGAELALDQILVSKFDADKGKLIPGAAVEASEMEIRFSANLPSPYLISCGRGTSGR